MRCLKQNSNDVDRKHNFNELEFRKWTHVVLLKKKITYTLLYFQKLNRMEIIKLLIYPSENRWFLRYGSGNKSTVRWKLTNLILKSRN